MSDCYHEWDQGVRFGVALGFCVGIAAALVYTLIAGIIRRHCHRVPEVLPLQTSSAIQ
jgi:hypothetical protein